MSENIKNAIIRLPMDRLRPNSVGHIPSCPRHVPSASVAMATVVAWERRIERSAVKDVWRPNA